MNSSFTAFHCQLTTLITTSPFQTTAAWDKYTNTKGKPFKKTEMVHSHPAVAKDHLCFQGIERLTCLKFFMKADERLKQIGIHPCSISGVSSCA